MGDTPPPPPPKIEVNSPFYLGPQDRPGDFITSQRLKLDNFNDWAHAIRIALSSRRKFGFLDGSIPTYVPPCTKDDWITIQCMLVSWLMNTIDPEQIKSEINACEQPKSMSVAVYFSKLSVLWDELNKHEPLIACKCGKCTCNIGKQHADRRDADRLQQFLLGLCSEYYAPLRSTLLSQEPLPTLNRAFQQISQDERVRGISRAKEEPPSSLVLGFAVRAGAGRGRGGSDKPPVCDRCKKVGHESSRCWADKICTHCKKKGHEENRCYDLHGWPNGVGRGRGQVRANATSASVLGSGPGSLSASNSSSNQVFTSEQWKAITGLMGNATLSDNRLSGKFDDTSWIIDTGATHHVTGEKHWIFDTKSFECPVGLPNGDTVSASLIGSVSLSDKITLTGVLYVPNLSCNLISVSQLNDDLNCTVQFNSYICAIQDQTKELIGTGTRRDGLYYFSKTDLVHHVSALAANSELVLWHRLMGHPSEKVVKLLPTVSNKACLDKGCEVCMRAKHPRDSFPLSDNKASRIFEKIHCDLWVPYRHVSSCGARYFFTIVDDYSRVVWIYLMNDKTEVFRMFFMFVAMVERQFSQTIKIVQSDNGTEFNCLRDYFDATGIIFQTPCVGTPQQNGRVERKHKQILSVGRALRFQAKLPIYFWGECVLAAAHLINRTPTPLLQNKTPFEILFDKPPMFDAIRTFGCLCFAHNQKTNGDKFASRSRKCVFVGYPFGKKGWRLYDLEAKVFFVSRDVKFIEDVFPFATPEDVNIEPHVYDSGYNVHDDFVEFEEGDVFVVNDVSNDTQELGERAPASSPAVADPQGGAAGVDTLAHQPSSRGTDHTAVRPRPEGTHRSLGAEATASSTEGVQQPGSSHATSDVGAAAPELLGRGFREKFSNVRHRDFVTHSVFANNPSPSTPSSNTPSGTPYPLAHYINCDKFSVNYCKFLAAIVGGHDPKSF
ncbi:uncharacterized protein LOC110712474 [Chenopodium quinoa]|uniref:uncharacterized protein LOC110712474 n=1 Tax=Chenopodium quinoa TaxID=63459 RepID=UPI000B77E075|nr:uncharacterized protein LOC110712474 [Chenopodium quinoa]